MKRSIRTTLLGITSWTALLAPSAMAQVPAARSPKTTSHQQGLTEIVVTAQKRSQRLQDVPIAITAINLAALQANRITSVTDLSGVAPNVVVRESGGSIGIPSFSIRGIVSYGVVPGSDKETSIYIDGVYIGSPSGSNFQLPDVQQIEVLRGPQGTLFGRNATAGAVSITTRDPTGVLGGRQEFTVGNYDQFRTRTSIDLPKIGPFSGFVSYVHNQRNGDIRNLGAGAVWDRTGPNTSQGVETSPKTLGAHDGNTYFGALKYEPNDVFKTIYKFDYATDVFSPDGVAAIGISPILPYLFSLSPYPITTDYTLDPSGKRPDAVNNAYTTNGYEKTYGHNLTSTVLVNDAITLKNILAYRYSFIYANTQLDGLGGGSIFGTPFEVVAINAQSENRQFSDEVQANYSSHWLTLTSGLLFFHQNTVSGAPPGLTNNQSFSALPDGRIPLGNDATSYNHATSMAAYVQPEVHITNQVDLVGGVRITNDKKSGTYVSGINAEGVETESFTPGPGGNVSTGTFSGRNYFGFKYRSTRPAWTLGVNYKPTHDTLLYAHYADSFVSGGAIGGVPFKPETASSFEVGGKADFLNHRLRTNIALFDVEYRNIQSAQSGLNVGYPQLGTVIVDLGNANAKGAEFELNARPIDPITLGFQLGYTDVYYTALSEAIKQSFGGAYVPTLIPKFTVGVSAQYESDPMWHDARFLARIDANWHAKELTQQVSQLTTPAFFALQYIPADWMLNTRVALTNITFGGHTMEIAGWAKNLANSRAPSFPLALGGLDLSSSFVQARTYGLDLSFQF